ncbi:hypothetical protein EDM54_22430 [Brevibacillus borstelensis]|nr:hypothetical protein EDM54_22430 [Brevibacillus borstelensis]
MENMSTLPNCPKCSSSYTYEDGVFLIRFWSDAVEIGICEEDLKVCTKNKKAASTSKRLLSFKIRRPKRARATGPRPASSALLKSSTSWKSCQ